MTLVIKRDEIISLPLGSKGVSFHRIESAIGDILIKKKNIMGSSDAPYELKLVPMVQYKLYIKIKENDKIVVNSVNISGVSHKFYSTDNNNLAISLTENDFCDDIIIDYDTQQDIRDKKINELI